MVPGLGNRWFVVLPDGAAGAAVGERLPGRQVLTYPSGHPCVVAGPSADMVCAEAGQTRVAVIGCAPVTADRLAALAARIGCLEDADAVTELPGSFHLVATVGGRVRVQGTASGMRRVFYARVDGVVVAADHARVLAALTGASLDTEAVAVRLLGMTPPVLATPLWQGVDQVPPGSALHIEPYRVGCRSWWSPPEPELAMEPGAAGFAGALTEAVQARADGVVAADLSGGLDSTPISFLADAAVKRRGGRLVTIGLGVDDPAHDDHIWVRRARNHLGGEHIEAHVGRLPSWFAGIATPVPGLDEPTRWLRALARTTAIAALLADRGATSHLTGHGGDEITLLPSCYLHDLARAHPGSVRAHLRAARTQARWPLTAAVRALADRTSYPAWLAAQAPLLTTPIPPIGRPDFGWQMPMRLPVWVTPAAVDTVTRRLRAIAPAARPYAPGRAQHQILSNLRATAWAVNAIQELTGRAGAAIHAPYLDDHVIAAALAVRLDQRAAPGRFKPLTTAAMRPHMPAECLARTTKAEFSADFYTGLRANRDQLQALADGSLLVELGLADRVAVGHECTRTPADAGPSMINLDTFIATENWLRALHPTDQDGQ